MATETMSGPVIIDLGLDRGEPETYRSPTRRTVPNWFGPLLVAALVLVTSFSSAAPPPPALAPLLTVPIGATDSYAVTDSGQLLAQSLGTLSSYDLGTGRLRWRAGAMAPIYRPRINSGVVLLRRWDNGPDGPSTLAISEATGRSAWRHRGSVVAITGSPVLLSVNGVRSLSGSGRRVEGDVRAVDPVTGAIRWTVHVPSTAVLMGVPGPPGAPTRMLLVHDDRTLAVHDLGTGRMLARASIPPADYAPDNPTISGGLIVLRHQLPWGSDEVSAYDPVTLNLVWARPAGGAELVEPCGRLTCLAGPYGVQAIDPSDGRQQWYRPGWRGVEERGRLLIAYGPDAGGTDPVGLADPNTGKVLVDLHGWRPLDGLGRDGRLLVTRLIDAGTRTIVAVADPGDAQPRPLADLPPGTGDCQAAPDRLICRSGAGELNVWAYRQDS